MIEKIVPCTVFSITCFDHMIKKTSQKQFSQSHDHLLSLKSIVVFIVSLPLLSTVSILLYTIIYYYSLLYNDSLAESMLTYLDSLRRSI